MDQSNLSDFHEPFQEYSYLKEPATNPFGFSISSEVHLPTIAEHEQFENESETLDAIDHSMVMDDIGTSLTTTVCGGTSTYQNIIFVEGANIRGPALLEFCHRFVQFVLRH